MSLFGFSSGQILRQAHVTPISVRQVLCVQFIVFKFIYTSNNANTYDKLVYSGDILCSKEQEQSYDVTRILNKIKSYPINSVPIIIGNMFEKKIQLFETKFTNKKYFVFEFNFHKRLCHRSFTGINQSIRMLNCFCSSACCAMCMITIKIYLCTHFFPSPPRYSFKTFFCLLKSASFAVR